MCVGDFIVVTEVTVRFVFTRHVVPCKVYVGISDRGVEYFCDNRMSMGLSSPYIFTHIGNFVARCATRMGIKYVANYLDDFALLGQRDSCSNSNSLIIIINNLLHHLGFFY